jgi:predicted component of type VI protein secretion system
VSEWRLQFRGTLFPIRVGEVTLGRSGYASIVVNNPLTSREHALVRLSGDTLELVDLGSKNGTFVNANRVTGAIALSDGDRIKIGTDVIDVLRTSAQDPTQLRAPTQPGRTLDARLDEGETDTTVHQKRSIDLAERLIEATRSAAEHPAIARSVVEILNDFLGDAPGHLVEPSDRQRILGLLAVLGEWKLGSEIDEWRRGIGSRLGAATDRR